jgi:hypothetical protein
MDPQAVIERLSKAASDPAANRDDIEEAAADLRRWIKGGGFLPTWDDRLINTVKGLDPKTKEFDTLEWVFCVVRFRLSCGAALDPIVFHLRLQTWHKPFWIRLDDRGDLMVWAFDTDGPSAMETAEEWAEEAGIAVDEEEITFWPADDHVLAVLDFRLALRDKAGEEE